MQFNLIANYPEKSLSSSSSRRLTGVPFESERAFTSLPTVTIMFLPAHPNVDVVPARVCKDDPNVPEFRSAPLSPSELTAICSAAFTSDPTATLRPAAAAIVLGSFRLQQYYDMASEVGR